MLLGYDVPLLSEKLDWISVMAYDYHGQWDEVTGHVAPMYEHPDDVDKTFNAVSQFVECFFFVFLVLYVHLDSVTIPSFCI